MIVEKYEKLLLIARSAYLLWNSVTSSYSNFILVSGSCEKYLNAYSLFLMKLLKSVLNKRSFRNNGLASLFYRRLLFIIAAGFSTGFYS